MNFPLRNKPKRNISLNKITIIILFLTLLIVSVSFKEGTISFFQNINKPFFLAKQKISAIENYIYQMIRIKDSLARENARLNDEIASLRLTKMDYEKLQKEYDELLLQYGYNNSRNKIISDVLSKPPQAPFDTWILDVGEKEGIRVGAKVYLSDEIIIGEIVNVSKNTSTLTLFSSNEKVESINSRTGSSLILLGKGGGNFKVEVPKDFDILWGDIFVIPGKGGGDIAVVYFIDNDLQGSFKGIFLRIPGNAVNAKKVLIEK